MATVRDKILELLATGPQPAASVHALGSRSFVQDNLNILIHDGIVFKHGRGKMTSYSMEATQRIFPHKKVVPLVLPDLPPLMLRWGGYTDKTPDPDAGHFIHGGQW